jgi:hypothetical protein
LTAVTMLTIVLLLAATAVCVAMIWVAFEVVATARSVRALTDDTGERLPSLLEKADVMVDAANAELLRIDTAVTRFEEASVRVAAASGTLSEIMQTPAGVVSNVADKVRRAWKDRRSRSAEEGLDAAVVVIDGEGVSVDAAEAGSEVLVTEWPEQAAEETGEWLETSGVGVGPAEQPDGQSTEESNSSEDPWPKTE